MHGFYRFVAIFLISAGAFKLARAQAVPDATRAADPHATEEWALVAPHLPDPVKASAQTLEQAGDVLRARRFPSDAITFYKASVINGGDVSRLLKKEGVVHLEMQQGLIARLCFQQAVKRAKRDSEAWNDLGAADFMLGNTHEAVSEYKRAVKLNRSSAVYHSNLSLAYFEMRDPGSARRELARAFALDPEIMHHANSGGYNLQILASTHYAEICFEMARAYAAQGDQEMTISWLTKAAERGFDVRGALKSDAQLGPYLQDERVRVMLANNEQIRKRELTARVKPVSLGAAASEVP